VFETVRAAFADNFAERGEVGAAVCVIVDGRVVVDLVGGWSDAARTLAWRPDTLVNFYSVGKALIGLLALQLVESGQISLDAPITDVWPEFGYGGKGTATLRHALSHRAGVPAIRERLTDDALWDWPRMTSALAATEAWWEPGTRHTYHTNTFGHLNGEIVRRASGAMPGERLRSVAGPLDADIWFGVPRSEQHRCAEVIWAPPSTLDFDLDALDAFDGEHLMNALAHVNPPGYSSIGVVNTPQWRSTQVPSTNGHGTATGLARLYAGLLRSGLLSTEGPGRGDAGAVAGLVPDPA
jgi:CubicO group peptidase (beta-lactamase class C family)